MLEDLDSVVVSGAEMSDLDKPISGNPTVDTKERIPVGVRKLYVLVHPLGGRVAVGGREMKVSEQFLQSSQIGHKDLLWFMPIKGTDSVGESKDLLKNIREFPPNEIKSTNWPAFYRNLRDKFGKKQVMLIPEFVLSGGAEEKITDSLGRALEIGYEINEETEVIVGGEYLEWCAKNGAVDLLNNLPVRQISLDLGSTVANSEDQYAAIAKVLFDVSNKKDWNMSAHYDASDQRIIIQKIPKERLEAVSK